MSIPRPAFDDSLGLVSACAQCHGDRTPAALDQRVRAWYGRLKPHAAPVEGLLHGVLLQPDARHPIAQFAGLAQFLEGQLAPDMAELTPDVEDRLRRLAQDPDLDVRALALASLHLARGSDRRVRRFLADRLAALGPEDDDAVRKRWAVALGFVADAYRGKSELARAIVSYRKALEIAPGDPRIHLNLGLAYADAHRFTEAVAEYQRSLEADPTQPLAHVNWGIALEAQGDTAGAVDRFRRALEIDPREPLAHFNLGAVALARRRAAEAIPLYLDAVANDPSLAPAHFDLARAYLLLGDYRRAAAALRDGLEFDPQNAAARGALDELERSLNRGH